MASSPPSALREGFLYGLEDVSQLLFEHNAIHARFEAESAAEKRSRRNAPLDTRRSDAHLRSMRCLVRRMIRITAALSTLVALPQH